MVLGSNPFAVRERIQSLTVPVRTSSIDMLPKKGRTWFRKRLGVMNCELICSKGNRFASQASAMLLKVTAGFKALSRCWGLLTPSATMMSMSLCRASGFVIEDFSPRITCACSRFSLPGTSRQYLPRSEEHTSELQSHSDLVCRLLLEKKKTQ